MIEELRKLVKDACGEHLNVFGWQVWEYHVEPVIKFSKILAKKINADEEICEIAAILHDYAGILDKKIILSIIS